MGGVLSLSRLGSAGLWREALFYVLLTALMAPESFQSPEFMFRIRGCVFFILFLLQRGRQAARWAVQPARGRSPAAPLCLVASLSS